MQHWQPAGLLGAPWIKPSLFTLAESIIDRQIGDLQPEDTFRIPQALALFLNNYYLP